MARQPGSRDRGIEDDELGGPPAVGTEMGALVRQRRKGLAFTLTQIAELADTTPQTIQKIEKGEIVPRDDLRIGLALALSTEVDQLFPLPRREVILREAVS